MLLAIKRLAAGMLAVALLAVGRLTVGGLLVSFESQDSAATGLRARRLPRLSRLSNRECCGLAALRPRRGSSY
jgi:hypothetical protein